MYAKEDRLLNGKNRIFNIISSCVDFNELNRIWVKLGENKEGFWKNVEYMQTKSEKYVF